ncbi:hypothetical protein [Streptomyces sp. NPDC088727]|uniref:hypothetical protein n=1 Tax=Streptomyces sp. NPDC088727 TaxID=3365875 RepID=UPI003826EEB0
MTIKKLSNNMITIMLNSLVRPSHTEDGQTVYPVRGIARTINAGTLKALATRGMIETDTRTVRTPGMNDGVPYQYHGQWLTEDGMAFLREALRLVMSTPGDDRPAVYREWLAVERNVPAAAVFLAPAEEPQERPAVEVLAADPIPAATSVRDGMPGRPVGVNGVRAVDALTDDAYVVQHRSGLTWVLPNHDDRAHMTRAQVLGGLAWARKAAPDRTRINVDTNGTVYASTGWSAARYLPVNLFSDYSEDSCPGCGTPYATNGDGPCEIKPTIPAAPEKTTMERAAELLGDGEHWTEHYRVFGRDEVTTPIDRAGALNRVDSALRMGDWQCYRADAGGVNLESDTGESCYWLKPVTDVSATATPREAGHVQMDRLAQKWSASVDTEIAEIERRAADKSQKQEPHGYTWADAREIMARDLKPGDVFVKPGTGNAYGVRRDGTMRGVGIAWETPMDGEAWTVTGRQGNTTTNRSHTGRELTEEIPKSARVLRVHQAPAPAMVFTREPWRGGQYCGHQTAYGMPGSEFCADRKASGLAMCQQHHDDTADESGAVHMAPGNALGDPTAPLALLWEPMEGDTPVRPTAGEYATYATVNVHIAAERDAENVRRFMGDAMRVNVHTFAGGENDRTDERSTVDRDTAIALALKEIEAGAMLTACGPGHARLQRHGHITTLHAETPPTPDDTTPLDEMGTDDLLTVLRENVADIPEESVFAEAWALMDRILTDGGPECLPAPWDTVDGDGNPGSSIPADADFETRTNLAVRFTPQAPDDTEGDTRPCMEVGTAQVYAYRENGRLVVGVESSGMDSTGESDETDANGNVPMEITVNGNVVYAS